MSIKCIQAVGERLIILKDEELWMCNFVHWGDLNQDKMWTKLKLPWDDERQQQELEKTFVETVAQIHKRKVINE